MFLAAALAAVAAKAHAAGALENPLPDARVSGIGVISGWHCSASRIEVQIDDGAPTPAAYGTDRLDTLSTCGKRDTGFGLLLNWAVVGPGTHTIRVLADGAEFARHRFTVTTLGAEFLRGKSGTVTLNDFPSIGKATVLEWQESLQSFVVREVRNDAPQLDGRWNGANLEARSDCTNALVNGQHGTYAQYSIGTADGAFSILENGVTGLVCEYRGTYRQDGADRHASGTYSCTDGKRGTFDTTSFLVTAHEMSITMDIQLTGAETCKIQAILGGSRY